MARSIYRWLSYVVFGLGFPVWWLLFPRLRGGLRQRFGDYGAVTGHGAWPPRRGPIVWFHGASAGDIRALRPVMARVRTARADASILVSAITDSGHRLAHAELSGLTDGVVYAPIDLPGATRRAMQAVRPNLLVLERAEFWPHLFAAAAVVECRIVLINGRLHPDRMFGYRWLSRIAGPPLARIERLLMQTPGDADRALALGAAAERVVVAGGTKVDDVEPPSRDEQAKLAAAMGPGPWLVAGSTHEEDEAVVRRAFAAVRAVDPKARLLLVPRYPDRASYVVAALRDPSWTVRRSSLKGDSDPPSEDVVVVDVVGKLRTAYGVGRLAIVGGTFGDRGGHNVLEPAAAGVPVVAGPDVSNNEDAARLLRGHGLIQVPDADGLAQVAVDLWTNASLRASLSKRGMERVRGASGAADRSARTVIELMATTDSRPTETA